MNKFTTPILFLIFNRPDTTRLVFEKIREIQPEQLFVAADGPRPNKEGENQKCDMARSIATAVDWDCDLKVLFRDENIGCGKAVSEGITWFFNHVEEGIILEDDCLPDKTFFTFCSVLLKRYKYDETIMHIGGNNFQFGIKRDNGDYYFSILAHIWGWASWRRAWRHYEYDLTSAKIPSEDSYKLAFNQNNLFINYYKHNFSEVRNNLIDTWDYQWLYAIIRMKGLAICPEVNLVQNIGFGEGATHTLNETEWNLLNISNPLYRYHEPSNLHINYEADKYFLREIIGLNESKIKNERIVNIFSILKKRVTIYFKHTFNLLKAN